MASELAAASVSDLGLIAGLPSASTAEWASLSESVWALASQTETDSELGSALESGSASGSAWEKALPSRVASVSELASAWVWPSGT